MKDMQHLISRAGRKNNNIELAGKPTAFSKANIWKKGNKTIPIYIFSVLQAGRRIFTEKIWQNGIERTVRKIYKPARPEQAATHSHHREYVLQ